MDKGRRVTRTRVLAFIAKRRAMRTLIRAAKLARNCKYYAETLRRLLEDDIDCQDGGLSNDS